MFSQSTKVVPMQKSSRIFQHELTWRASATSPAIALQHFTRALLRSGSAPSATIVFSRVYSAVGGAANAYKSVLLLQRKNATMQSAP